MCIDIKNFGVGLTVWQFTTNPPMFYPPIIFILAALLCKAVNSPMLFLPMFFHQNIFGQQSTKLAAKVLCYMIYDIHYRLMIIEE